jgi:hypothetical protein
MSIADVSRLPDLASPPEIAAAAPIRATPGETVDLSNRASDYDGSVVKYYVNLT